MPGQEEHRSILPPAGLEDFQVGWYWNLFWTALRNADHPGFLASRKNLWTFAGAHRRAHWDANCALVMAAFELREISGQKLWCLPPLVAIVEEQMKKLKEKKGRGDLHNSHSLPQTVGDSSPPLQSGFAFDLDSSVSQNQIQKPSSTRMRARAREMRAEAQLLDQEGSPSYAAEMRLCAAEMEAEANDSSPAPVHVEKALSTTVYTQADFDARDLRKMAQAWDTLLKRNPEGMSRASGWTDRRMFEWVCENAGVTIARGLELEEHRKKWPEKVPDWLKEETG